MSKGCHCEEGLPEWIMSYADMITILMAFFVVMYSMAGDRDNKKSEAVMESLRTWLGPTAHAWPNSRTPLGMRVQTAYDTPAPPDRHRGATQNTNATVPQPMQAYPDGATVFLSANSKALNEANKDQLDHVLETVSGKMNLIEIRGQAKRHAQRDGTLTQNSADLVYDKCRMAMDYLISRGIDPERIQVRIIRAEAESTAAEMALLHRDVQLDVFMLNQLLERQPGVKLRFGEPLRQRIEEFNRQIMSGAASTD